MKQGYAKKKKSFKVNPLVATGCRLIIIFTSNEWSSLMLPELNLGSHPGLWFTLSSLRLLQDLQSLLFHRKVQFVSIKAQLITKYGGQFSWPLKRVLPQLVFGLLEMLVKVWSLFSFIWSCQYGERDRGEVDCPSRKDKENGWNVQRLKGQELSQLRLPRLLQCACGQPPAPKLQCLFQFPHSQPPLRWPCSHSDLLYTWNGKLSSLWM